MINVNDLVFMAGDFNSFRGDYGFSTRNDERWLLGFSEENNLLVYYANFRKTASHLITYQPGGYTNQIDHILTRK